MNKRHLRGAPPHFGGRLERPPAFEPALAATAPRYDPQRDGDGHGFQNWRSGWDLFALRNARRPGLRSHRSLQSAGAIQRPSIVKEQPERQVAIADVTREDETQLPCHLTDARLPGSMRQPTLCCAPDCSSQRSSAPVASQDSAVPLQGFTHPPVCLAGAPSARQICPPLNVDSARHLDPLCIHPAEVVGQQTCDH